MITVPRFRSQFYVQVVPPDRVFLTSESGHFVLQASSCAAVAELIDGQRSVDDIVEAVAERMSMNQAYYVLTFLEKKQYIEEATTALSNSAAAFWNAFGVDGQSAARKLASTGVAATSFGDVPYRELLEMFEASNIRVVDNDNAALTVVLVDDYLQSGLDEFNRKALRERKPWLLAKPNGQYGWIGPLFRPGWSACWMCLSQRLHANRDVESFLREVAGRREPYVATAALPSTLCAALSLTATEVAKWIVLGHNEQVDDKIITVNLARLQTQEHTLVRRPQCPCCGDPGLQARMFGPIVLRSCPKLHVTDGGHRASSPEETLRKYEHHVSPITGIVNRLVRITDASDPLQHVYISGANMAIRHLNYDLLRSTLRSRTAGKGKSDVQAKVSAIGEAIERYSGTYRGDEARITGSFRCLGNRAVDPRTCLLFSEAQYRERERWLAYNSPFMRIPLPFDEDVEIEWAPLWSLTRQGVRYLPMEYCYYAYPIAYDRHFCLPDSNGCAAGNTLEEAILQGFLELVERDAVAVWWYNRIPRPAVDLDSLDEQYIDDLVRLHASIHRDLWVLDVSHDLEIPAFVAVSRRNDKPMEDIVFAPAAHLDFRVAILRALTELNQLITAVVDVGEDGEYTFDDEHSVRWWKTATVANQPHLVPDTELVAKTAADYRREWSGDICADIGDCRALVERRGLEMLILDQTRPDIGMKVAKVVVPGLRHFWARFAPGRLYDVPVQQGWLREPLSEDQLNPIPIFI